MRNPSTSSEPSGTNRRTRFQNLCTQLSNLVHEYGPGAKLPTVLHMCDLTGVSVATLNSALSELEAQKLIVRKHGIGIYVSPTLHQKCVSLICDTSFFGVSGVSPFWDLLVEQMRLRAQAGAEAFSFHLALPDHGGGQRKVALHDGLIQEIETGCVQGIISVGLDEDIADWIDAQGVPNVAFAGPGRYVVALDAEELVGTAVDQLAAQGCRKIAFWQSASPRRKILIPTELTAQGEAFAEALVRNGLEFDAKRVRFGADHLSGDDVIITEATQEQGYRIATEVFSGPKGSLPDGIVLNEDLLTRGALIALDKLGWQPGRDVKIATHANRGSTVLMGHEDELTFIEFDPTEIVQAIFGMLETLMNGEIPAQSNVFLRAKLRT